MNDLPPDLIAVLPEGSVDAARSWWVSLAESDRSRVATLWDERLEVRFFEPQSDESGLPDGWEKVPHVSGGRYMPKDDDGGISEWGQDRFEYLLSNPELILAYEPERRIFGICTQHPVARACVENGRVPSDFQCPFAAGACPFDSGACPMEALRGAELIKRADRQRTASALTSLDQTFDVKEFLAQLERETRDRVDHGNLPDPSS